MKGNSLSNDIQTKSIWSFLIMTFAITWGIIAIYFITPGLAKNLFGELHDKHPLFFIGMYSPSITAIFLVWYHFKLKGVKKFLSRALLWRAPINWWIFILAGTPLVFIAGSLIKGNLSESFMSDEVMATLPSLLLLRLFMGTLEEFGWRGFAQPLLQRKYSPLTTSVFIGTVWGIWHLPIFFMSNMVQSQWGFFPFLLGNIFLSIIFTGIFNSSKGSIFLAALFHYQLINPLWPDAQPYDTYCFALVAIAVVFINKKTMLSSAQAYKNIIPAESEYAS
ncbi:MAG: CPBP family intramembrane metalloprotease [Bdellovibrionaceae bacterium]|jgi:uncharacterized protein|nr:CPBP family intramembrane metalloprotease [Pseudobdellovibrionaceae bacterium]